VIGWMGGDLCCLFVCEIWLWLGGLLGVGVGILQV
jgi:hypothetical protein